MTILRIEAKGQTRLEALHTLLSEMERLEINSVFGTVLIEMRWIGHRDPKIEYTARWSA